MHRDATIIDWEISFISYTFGKPLSTMRILFVGFFLLFFSNSSFAQIGIRVFDYRPTGELGFVMKPLVSGEISWVEAFDGRMRSNISLTYLKMKPRMEVFPVYGVLNGNYVLPGEQSFQKYSIYELMGGIDFACVQEEPFNIYIGGDLIVGGASIEYTEIIQNWSETSYSGGGILAGLRFRAGVDYSINDQMGLYFNANRSFFLISEPAGIFSGNDYGIGFRYSWQ